MFWKAHKQYPQIQYSNVQNNTKAQKYNTANKRVAIDVKLLTFCMSFGWESEKHESNAINAITNDRLDIAHALTEFKGIPIVVQVIEGIHL